MRHRDQTSLHPRNDGDVRRGDGACDGDAARRDDAVVHAMLRVGAEHADEKGDDGTGVRALDAVDEEVEVGVDGHASVDANGGEPVLGQSVGLATSLALYLVHFSPALLGGVLPNPCRQQALNSTQDILVLC